MHKAPKALGALQEYAGQPRLLHFSMSTSDPRLELLISRWPELPERVRKAIAVLVE